MKERREFNLCWGEVGSPGEAGDAARTVEDVRRVLGAATGSIRLVCGPGVAAKVRAALTESELIRVNVEEQRG